MRIKGAVTPYISLYVEEGTMNSLRYAAALHNTSVSAYAAQIISKSAAAEQFEGIESLFGSIDDPSFEARTNFRLRWMPRGNRCNTFVLAECGGRVREVAWTNLLFGVSGRLFMKKGRQSRNDSLSCFC